MLKVSNATMNKMGRARITRGGRSTPTDRGGIRKRGATRMDRDGDLDMNALSERGRGGKRGRGDSGRGSAFAPGRKAVIDRERTINTIHKALSSNAESQANIRTIHPKGQILEQVSVRGWKQSKAASNPDGGIESLVSWLEKKVAPLDSKSMSKISNNNITKVCATSASCGHQQIFTVIVSWCVFVSRQCSLATIDLPPRPCSSLWVTAV